MVTTTQSYKTSRGMLESDLIRAFAHEIEYKLGEKDEHFNFSRALTLLNARIEILGFFREFWSIRGQERNVENYKEAAALLHKAELLLRQVGP